MTDPLRHSNQMFAVGWGDRSRMLELAAQVAPAVWVKPRHLGPNREGVDATLFRYWENLSLGPFANHRPLIHYFGFDRTEQENFVSCSGDQAACQKAVEWLVGVEVGERSSPHFADFSYHAPVEEGGMHVFSLRRDNPTRGIEAFEFRVKPAIEEEG